MPKETNDLPPPVNHVFVDYENVHAVDPAIIGSKTVHVTLLLGAKNTKLDATVVEKLLQHAATVELIRLTSSGRNALDFTLAYYLGRAVLADPGGFFHIVSKDKGYDALIEHLHRKHIHIRRHESYATLKSSGPTAPGAPPKPKVQSKPMSRQPDLDERAAQVLQHFRKPSANRPKNKTKLVSFIIAHLGHKLTEAEALKLVEELRQAGHLVISEKGAVNYYLEKK